jgi:hypothetical protein
MEGYLLKFADFMSVVSYLVQEFERGGKTLSMESFQVHKYSREFDDPRYNFIRPWVESVKLMIGGPNEPKSDTERQG